MTAVPSASVVVYPSFKDHERLLAGSFRARLQASLPSRDRRMTDSGGLDPDKAYLPTSLWRASSCLATPLPVSLAGM